MNENTMTTDDKGGAVQDAGELSVEAVRQLIEREYKETLPKNAPELLMVPIMQAALNEEKRLQESHRKKLAEVMDGMVNGLAEAVKRESAGVSEKLSGVAVQELRHVSAALHESSTAVSARLSGHAIALYLCTGIIAVSALVNVYVFLVR
ncbi:hypothetical protein [uncultured Desulfovibrio sp.]|uniref:hypothetical protein n=1 Tax=uncultured Desulfovibrio sp. TaxID=167968 RepID=UPI0026280D93|nr:hypothetical protein [uncultured Desulfovibrio sp.]